MQIKINSSSGNFKFSTFEQKRGHYLEFIALLLAEFSKFGINVFHKSIAFMFRVCKKILKVYGISFAPITFLNYL